ncbi:MAG: DUF445 domain-containing protein [Bdellovibrionota bacterium]|jgi:uncharacterized membrane protein YheB (UPF0754 family)
MDRTLMLYTLPFIAALIGWITNYVAVRMLFRPRKPYKIFFYTLQGVFPKRQKELAKQVADIFVSEFLDSKDLKENLGRVLRSADLKRMIDLHIQGVIKNKVATFLPILPRHYANSLVDKIGFAYKDELDPLMETIIHRILESPDVVPDIRNLIEDRIANFSVEKLELLCEGVLHKEFRFIELVGAVLGFIVGVIQMLIAYLSY